ncbi:MAG: hypothetical protein WAV98_00410 [Minisyncoccia bacterium]
MEPTVTHKKLEPGVFQGRPEASESEKVVPPRLIRTMMEDVAEAIKNQNETTVSIAIAEEKKHVIARAEETTRKVPPENTSPAAKPIGRVIVVTVALLILASLGFAYIFVLPKFSAIELPSISIPSFSYFDNKLTTSSIATTTSIKSTVPTLMPAQEETIFNITKQSRTEIFAEITSEMKKNLSSGFIKNLYFTEEINGKLTVVSANRLFVFANISMPEILRRSIEKPFMAGFYGDESGGAIPFVILKISGGDTSLAGMLEWETSLPEFFDTIFGVSTSNGATSKTKFLDVTVLGKNARVVDTAFSGTIAYVFANPYTIVIAGSQQVLEAILPIASKI